MANTSKTLKQIAVSKANYLALKELGKAGDSFNDVITEVLKKVEAEDCQCYNRSVLH